MLIDSYDPEWVEHLRAQAGDLEADRQLYLLIDGVFLPGLYREIGAVLPHGALTLLFESLPGCSDAARNVSPFLIHYLADSKRLNQLLKNCSTWPMISAIETDETLEQLTARLASWCVVYADGQRFNFRFPDTRRLPGIFKALTAEQRSQLAGPAFRWRYVDRSGRWADLPVTGVSASIIPEWPELDAGQFGQMVGDSEPDEMMLRLSDRGHEWTLEPSRRHAIMSQALLLADEASLEQTLRIDWCEACVLDAGLSGLSPNSEQLASWRSTAMQA
jgi:hypothetical protein